ncbi:MAG TPA: rRNA maturation RNase YbeY [Candidatus Acidoferrales bacterium]|nr:rRNA maturation RNase YbeY [Candidatus Acidoferrales bacterium]
MPIYLRRTTRKWHLSQAKIEKTVRALLAAVDEPTSSLSISLVGDRAIRTLNRAHRGKDRPTDVLSFPLFEPQAFKRKNRTQSERLLGDIVISLDTAARQAKAYDASLQAEVERLLIHGVLHLLGHDHEKPGERRRMEAEERRLADAIGMRWPYPG